MIPVCVDWNNFVLIYISGIFIDVIQVSVVERPILKVFGFLFERAIRKTTQPERMGEQFIFYGDAGDVKKGMFKGD